MDKSIGPRCEICDRTEREGSFLADAAPDPDVTVRLRPNGEILCSICYVTILNDLTGFEPFHAEDGEVELIDPEFEDFES